MESLFFSPPGRSYFSAKQSLFGRFVFRSAPVTPLLENYRKEQIMTIRELADKYGYGVGIVTV
ncbi:MAG: hypothetical protein VYC39_06960 [Myxococcota bacterium]|nr:hypothetical protein [Myxococcota bacterium]